jgi:hypothetical protein
MTPLRINLPGQRLRAARAARAADVTDEIAEGTTLAEHHLQRPCGFGGNVPGIAQRQARRNRQAVASVAPALGENLQIQREHQRRAARGDRPLDQRLIEAAIAHQILLEPKRLIARRTHVLDRADGHRAQAERDAECGRRAGTQDLAVGVVQAAKARRRDGERNRGRGSRKGGRELDVGHVDHDARAQLNRIEVRRIRPQRRLLIGASVRIVENGARYAPPGARAQVLDAQDHVRYSSGGSDE